MRTCQCTLPYTNPKACESCPNNKEIEDFNSLKIPTSPSNANWPQDFSKPTEPKNPYKRTVTEYDKEGKVTKVIVEEFEIIPLGVFLPDSAFSVSEIKTVTNGTSL